MLYRPGACSYARAMTIPTRMVLVSVAMMAMMAYPGQLCSSLTQTPGSIRAASTWVLPWEPGVGGGYDVAWTPKCSRRCVLSVSSSDGNALGR